MDDAYGPTLPPGFKSRPNTEDSDDEYGPSVPSKSQIGPMIPGHLHPENSDDEEDSSDEDIYGPMPPNNDAVKKSSISIGLSDDDDDMYGPALPPHLLNKKPESHESERKQVPVGPSLPPGYKPPQLSEVRSLEDESSDPSDDDDGNVIGPMPSTKAFDEEEYRIREMELRAKKMRDKIEGKGGEEKLERESWMLELPTDRPKSQLLAVTGPRQFKSKTPAERGDRTVWTDSPAEREARKQGKHMDKDDIEMTPQMLASLKRDAETAAVVESYNEKKRAKPLVDMHRDKMAAKTSKSDKYERKPFNREDDMCVNKFDDAQKASMLKKARDLDTRFGAGERKFL